MKIGVSLSMDVLCGTPKNEAQRSLLGTLGPDGLLSLLKAEGVTHIEIRTVHAGDSYERIALAAKTIRTAGLQITVHGELREEDPEGFIEQLRPVLTRQSEVTVTVHPVKNRCSAEENADATVAALQKLASSMQKRDTHIHLALENCRMASSPDASLSPEGILHSLLSCGCDAFGSCWDFGHFCSDHLVWPETVPENLPSLSFASRTVHTHIHDLNGRTHFPLGTGCLPLGDYLRFLAGIGYTGVYNLELEPERWAERYPDVCRQLIDSVRMLREALSVLPLPEDHPDRLSIFGTCSGTEPMPGRHHCSFAITHNGRHYWFDAGEGCAYTAHLMGLDLQDIRAVFISHPHLDHIGGLTNLLGAIRKLDGMYHGRSGNPLPVYVPDENFWRAQMDLFRQTGTGPLSDIYAERVQDGMLFDEEGFSVEALHNYHLPHCGKDPWRSYSYRIRVGGKTIVFTGDVRSLPEISPLLKGADIILAETGHHHPVKICRDLMDLDAVPSQLFFIHHGRAILEGGEIPVNEARSFYPGRITVLNDGDTFLLSDL